MAVLAGCGQQCRPSCQTEVLFGDDRNSTHGAALKQTADAFVRGDSWKKLRQGAGADAAKSNGFGIDPGAIGPDGDTPFAVTHSNSIGLRHQRSFPMFGQVQGYGSVAATVGRTRYYLPEGMGVAKDPTTIDMFSTSLQPEVGVQRSWHVGRASLISAAGIGAQFSETTTSVQSNLLNVVYRSTQTQYYAALRLQVQPDFTPVSAALEARVAKDGATQFRGDMSLRY